MYVLRHYYISIQSKRVLQFDRKQLLDEDSNDGIIEEEG